MFRKWLETDTNASWKKLIAALQSPAIQLNFLAKNIQKMMLKGEPMFTNSAGTNGITFEHSFVKV